MQLADEVLENIFDASTGKIYHIDTELELERKSFVAHQVGETTKDDAPPFAATFYNRRSTMMAVKSS